MFEGLGTGLVTGALDYFSAKDTQSKQKKVAREQMAFQERMANTRYQRTMKDMKAAGLNPMLAFSQGGGPVPSGAQPNLVTPTPGASSAKGMQAGQTASLQSMQKKQVAENVALTANQASTAAQIARKEKSAADIAEIDAAFAKKYPNQVPAWKIGGLKAGAMSTAMEGANSAKSFLQGIKQNFKTIDTYQRSKKPKLSGARRRKSRNRNR